MQKIIACVDGGPSAGSVCESAIWAAPRLAAPLAFLHVLDRHPERAPVTDFSGSIGLGTQETRLQELGALDEERSRIAQRQGRAFLDGAMARARVAGLTQVESLQRHGALVDSLLDLEAETRLFVLGQHHDSAGRGRLHLDHTVERLIRAARRPILVAAPGFKAPERFAVAFDGSATAQTMVDMVAASPLLKGLPCDVVLVGSDSVDSAAHLNWARARLEATGFEVRTVALEGNVESAIAHHVEESADLLVIGAYGHSRIRQFIVGSSTTTLLRTSAVPVLVLR